MKNSGDESAVRRKTVELALAGLALFATHRILASLAARPLENLVRGYSDAELLAPGGDLALELVLQHEHTLLPALGSAGVWLLGGRIVVFLASFLLHNSAFSLATATHGAQSGVRRLHLAWALLLVAASSLFGWALVVPLGWGSIRVAGWLRETHATAWSSYLAIALLLLALIWLVYAVWFELFRLALAGARLRPVAAAKLAVRAFRHGLLGLVLHRLGLALAGSAVIALGGFLLPAVTRAGSAGQRAIASLTVDLALLGSVYLRAAWLTWASAHLAYSEAAGLRLENSEAAPPSAEPVVPADPTPDPDA